VSGFQEHRVEAGFDLVLRMQQGDENALGEFFDHWYPVVHALLTRMLQSNEDVDDAIEETFWHAWTHVGVLGLETVSVQTWLLTIARRHGLARLRPERSAGVDRVNGDGVEHRYAAIASAPSSENPRIGADHFVQKQRVDDALAKLSREQREALELAYFRGLSQAEIASRTAAPLEHVKTGLGQAMHTLSREIGLATARVVS
jgi:RNA polymerase sigma-70 factor (ECF subfamily)